MNNVLTNKISFENPLKELVIIVPIIIVAIIVLLPTNFESGGECYNEWAAAKMIVDGYGFPVTYISPTYVIYSAILLYLFEYTSFILIEYLISYSFFFICMYLSLRSFTSPFYAFIFCISFMPVLSTVEGHNTVICCGFLFLYLKSYGPNNENNSYVTFLPLQLLFASTFNSAAVPFLMGHFLVSVLQNKKLNFSKEISISKTFVLVFLISLYFVANINQSTREDNNYFMLEQPYAPIEFKSPIEIGIFQVAPHLYAIRNYENAELVKKDWYFESVNLLSNAKNLKDIFIHSKEIMLSNILVNLRNLFFVPNQFIFQYNNIILKLLSLSIVSISLFYSFYYFYINRSFSILFAILLGSLGTLSIFLLIMTHNFRYNIIFFPIITPLIFFNIHKIQNIYFKKFRINYLLNTFVLFVLISSILSYRDKGFFSNFESFDMPFYNGNYALNYSFLSQEFSSDDIVLTTNKNELWLKTFLNLDYKKIISLDELPPFENNEIKQDLMKKISKIWIDESVTKPIIRSASNPYLRFKEFIEPEIKNKEWTLQKIKNLGIIYTRKNDST